MGNNKISDPVAHPDHYANNCSMECWDAMKVVLGTEGFVQYCIGNAFKYIWRSRFKGKPEEDMAKAEEYLREASFFKPYISNGLADRLGMMYTLVGIYGFDDDRRDEEEDISDEEYEAKKEELMKSIKDSLETIFNFVNNETVPEEDIPEAPYWLMTEEERNNVLEELEKILDFLGNIDRRSKYFEPAKSPIISIAKITKILTEDTGRKADS